MIHRKGREFWDFDQLAGIHKSTYLLKCYKI